MTMEWNVISLNNDLYLIIRDIESLTFMSITQTKQNFLHIYNA